MKDTFIQKAADMVGKRVDLDLSTKAVSLDEKSHTATFVMSTATVDRHGDIVDQDSWILTHFAENAPLFWGHCSNDFPLGKWLRVWLEPDPEMAGKKMLMGEAEFAVDLHADIERAWKHVVRGDLNMVSVGFIPHIVEYDEETDAFVLKSCELIECSLVGIGANRRALIKSEEAITQEIVEDIIDINKRIEDNLGPIDGLEGIRQRNARTLLHKAVRQLSK